MFFSLQQSEISGILLCESRCLLDIFISVGRKLNVLSMPVCLHERQFLFFDMTELSEGHQLVLQSMYYGCMLLVSILCVIQGVHSPQIRFLQLNGQSLSVLQIHCKLFVLYL